MKLWQIKKASGSQIPNVKLDSIGLAKLENKLAKKQEELIMVYAEEKEDFSHNCSDWHAPKFSEKVAMLKYDIEKLKAMIDNAIIIENNATLDEKTINIGDAVEVNLIYSEDDQERMLIRLGTEHQTEAEDGIEVISLNSELGKVLYEAKVGTTVKFGTKKEFSAEILKKINEDSKEEADEKAKQFSKK